MQIKMNSIASTILLTHQKKLFWMIKKPLCCLSYQSLGILNIHFRKELKINFWKDYDKKNDLNKRILFLNIHVNGHRYFRRRPLRATYHEKYSQTTLDDYVKEAKFQAADIPNYDEIIQSPETPPSSQEKEESPIEKNTSIDISVKKYDWREKEETQEIKEQKKVLRNLNFKLYIKAPYNIKSYFEKVKSSKNRQKADVFCLEGWRLIVDALLCGLKPKAIFYSWSKVFLNMIPAVSPNEKELAAYLNLFPLYKTPYKTFKLWSSLVTPPGIMAVFPLSSAEVLCSTSPKDSFPLTIILDEIRDPNNMGSIIRTLAAVGVRKVILMKGCCDLWDLKVIRAASGAHFHLHCVTKVTWSDLASHIDSVSSSSIFLADACHEFSPVEADTDESENIQPQQSNHLFRWSHDELKHLGQTHSEHNTYCDIGEDGSKTMRNVSFDDSDHLSNFQNAQLPHLFYDKVHFFSDKWDDSNSLVLILGGETGLSSCAKKFAIENDAIQIAIPLFNHVESLNSAVTAGILVYEMQKQFVAFAKKENVKNSST